MRVAVELMVDKLIFDHDGQLRRRVCALLCRACSKYVYSYMNVGRQAGDQ